MKVIFLHLSFCHSVHGGLFLWVYTPHETATKVGCIHPTGMHSWDTFEFFILSTLLEPSKRVTYVRYRCTSKFISVLSNFLPFVQVSCHVNKFNDTSSSSFEHPQFLSIHLCWFILVIGIRVSCVFCLCSENLFIELTMFSCD